VRHTAHPWLWVCSRSLDPRLGRVGPPLLLLRPSSSPEVGGWSVGLEPRTPAVVELGPCSLGLRRSGVPVCLFVCSQIGGSLLFQGRIPPRGGCVFRRRGPKAAGAVWDVARRSTPHRWVVRFSRPEALSSLRSCSPVCVFSDRWLPVVSGANPSLRWLCVLPPRPEGSGSGLGCGQEVDASPVGGAVLSA